MIRRKSLCRKNWAVVGVAPYLRSRVFPKVQIPSAMQQSGRAQKWVLGCSVSRSPCSGLSRLVRLNPHQITTPRKSERNEASFLQCGHFIPSMLSKIHDFKYSPIIVVEDQKTPNAFYNVSHFADRNRTLRGQPKIEIKTLSKCLLRITVLQLLLLCLLFHLFFPLLHYLPVVNSSGSNLHGLDSSSVGQYLNNHYGCLQ